MTESSKIMRVCRLLLLASLLALASSACAGEAGHPWLLVDTQARTLTVLQGKGHVLKRYPRAALGSGGVAREHHRGDNKTPLGTFHVAWINYNSRFQIFFGLDLPSMDDADHAYRQHLIDRATYDAFIDAALARRPPPQGTPLGGGIGIHGLGRGNLDIHRDFDWTDGCIALTNGEIRSLAQWVRIGTKVVIR